MRTKFHIIIGGDSHEVDATDIKNWDEVKFTLERKDYSGVVRSFSSQFEFVGESFKLLRDLYLADGFLASAQIAVSTKNDNWTYTEQFRCPLDFSTVEIENETLAISSIDNTLAGLIKAQKSTKYEFPVSDFDTEAIEVKRITMTNSQQFSIKVSSYEGVLSKLDYVELAKTTDKIVTTEYIQPYDETHAAPANSFFAQVVKIGATLSVYVKGVVRCYYSPARKGFPYRDPRTYQEITIPVAELQVRTCQVDESDYTSAALLCNDDIMHKTVNGVTYTTRLEGPHYGVFHTLSELQAYSGYLINGMFGIVGSENDRGYEPYWQQNTVYEYQNGYWINKGTPDNYYQDRNVGVGYGNGTASLGTDKLTTGCLVQLWCTEKMKLMYSSMEIKWNDPAESSLACRAITPVDLATKIVQAIYPSGSVTVDENTLTPFTRIVAAEELRQMTDAKIYSTFQQFADWIGAVFGYTYRIDGNVVRFLHRSDAFLNEVVKVVGEVSEVKYSVKSDIIYSEVQAGYSKKEYGEINGRYETNFTNYYTTGYNSTDKKLQLISKYRADSYGIEFTARKSNSETQDDKADEDVFVLYVTASKTYNPGNSLYRPEVCVANNAAYLAAFGNGAAVTLTMTSSDGNNDLADVEIEAGTALFTAGVLEFKTDDMILPEEWNGLIQLDYNGYRYRGYISKAEAAFGRTDGIEYTLIVKDITAL